MVKSICIVAEDYPEEGHPLFTFVQQLAYGLSNENVTCSIVAPQSATKALFHRSHLIKKESFDISPERKRISVYRPYTLTFSNTRNKVLCKLSQKTILHAVKKGIKRNRSVDVFYCYFWHTGLNVASMLIRDKNNTPLFVQASECELTLNEFHMRKQNIERVTGVVCASRKNFDESTEAGLLQGKLDKTIIVPNGYRNDEFFVMDKLHARQSMNIPSDAFVVAFVGGFIERKGVRQLSEALDRFDDVFSIFIGQGNEEPTCKNILFKGKVQHNQLREYLNCADVFVLPTSAEGCCNAIIEALACGLPVISSNKSFNDEIIDSTCSIRINEQDIEALYQAIKALKNDRSKLLEMSQNALKKSKELTIENRIHKIRTFIEENSLGE